jgi:hypothetical protein
MTRKIEPTRAKFANVPEVASSVIFEYYLGEITSRVNPRRGLLSVGVVRK